jgi:hypothetical protein
VIGARPRPAGLISGVAWVVLAGAALELTAREVARRPLFPAPLGGGWGAATLVAVAALAALLAFVGAARPRRGSAGTPLLFAVLFTAGVAAQLALGARLQSDGFYYFAYLRSLAFDRDVNFVNDYRLLGLGDKTHLFQLTRTGHAQSAWTIGPAILWSPFFAAGHAVALELNESDPDVSTNGISFPYRQAVCIAGLVYGLLGCWFTYRLAGLFIDRRLAAAATAATVTGSFMLWYLVKEPSMTHAPSMALVAAFTWRWAATRERRSRAQWVVLGLIAGGMTLVRWQNAIFALLPACDAASGILSGWRRGDTPAVRRTFVDGVLFTVAASVAFAPQMIAWRAIYGSWLAVSPVGPQIRWWDPHLIDILWSSRNGLFSTSPILYVGGLGLVVLTRARPHVGAPAVAAIAVMTYFNASIQDWWGSAGFGGRRFDGALPLLALGVAQAAATAIAALRRFPGLAVATAAAALILWNVTQIAIAQAGQLRIGEAVSFGDTMAAQARAFHGWFGNPFTYPISLAYALRNGVSPGRYDLLSANRFLGDPLQPYGRIDIGADDGWVLGDGWHQPEREGPVTFRWAAPSASVLVPLDHAAGLRVQLRIHSFAYPGSPPQSVTVVVNGHEHGPLGVDPGWHVAEQDVPPHSWRAGVNRLELRFAWGRAPMDVGLGQDSRLLAAAVDYIRVAKK